MSPTIHPSNRNQAPSEQPFSLKQGQIFHGSIRRLLPNQMAEVQVGTQKMMAKLEAPLKAGDAHYFQVTGGKANLQLKVVTGALQSSTNGSGQIRQLMESLQLPKSAEMQALVRHVVKEGIPLSREQVIQAEQLLKNLPPKVKLPEGLIAIQKMSELKQPFTHEIFRSVISGQDKSGLHNLLDTFRQMLQMDLTISSTQRDSIQKVLAQMAQPFATELGGAVVGQVIERLLSANSRQSDKIALLNLLKEVDLVPKQATLENWLSKPTVTQTPVAGESTSIGQLLALVQKPVNAQGQLQSLQRELQQNTLLSQESKQQIQQSIQKALHSSQGTTEWNKAIQTLTTGVMKGFAEATQTSPFQSDQKSLTPKEHVLSLLTALTGAQGDSKVLAQLPDLFSRSTQLTVQQALSAAESSVQSGINQVAIEQAMKQILGDIGLSYEAKLVQQGTNLSQLSDSLKPQLLALLQDASIAAPVKEAAELLISRLNGLQILSGENGPQYQLLMQVPLDFLGKRMDATLQWSGRMKEDGKIDSSYARVMFYLDLASLKETVIDMQVQNRVITLNIFNESDSLQPYAEPFKEALKAGLSSLNYQLSGVFIKNFAKQPASTSLASRIQTSVGGVDIRI